jgi:hypothetical protein
MNKGQAYNTKLRLSSRRSWTKQASHLAGQLTGVPSWGAT